MKNPHEVPMAWKLGAVATVLGLMLLVLGTLAYLAYTAHGACQSEAHLADLCGDRGTK